MKKIVYVVLGAAAIIFISGRIQSSQNVLSENNTRPALNETKADAKLPASESKPKILFLVDEKNSDSKMTPALWWIKQEKKDGC